MPGLNLEGEELAPTIDNRRRGEEEPTLTIDDESIDKDEKLVFTDHFKDNSLNYGSKYVSNFFNCFLNY